MSEKVTFSTETVENDLPTTYTPFARSNM